MLLAVMAICIRVNHLLDVSFWFDEACAWRISQFTWGEMWDAILRDAHPPVGYLLQAAWGRMLGTSVASVRLLSLLCGLGAVVGMSLLAGLCVRNAEERLNSRAGVITIGLAAGLLAFSPLQITFSQQARPYAFCVLLSLLTAAWLMQALERPQKWGWWTVFALTGLLLSMTHYSGLFTLMGLFLFGLGETFMDRRGSWTHRENVRRWQGLAGSLVLIQAGWWFWLPFFQNQCLRANAQLWLAPFTWTHWREVCTASLIVDGGTLMPSSLSSLANGTWVIWGSVPVLAALICGRGGRLVFWGTVIPLAGMTAYSILVRNILEARLLCSTQAMLCLGVALLVGRIRSPLTQTLCLWGVGIAVFWNCGKYAEQRHWHGNHAGLRAAIDMLNRVRQADEPIIACSPFLFVSLVTQLRTPEHVYVEYSGDHRQDVLGGPPLRPRDYESVPDLIDTHPDTIWTVDADQMFGRAFQVRIPDSYRPVKQIRFAETFGIPAEIVVRGYHFQSSSPF